MINKLTFFKVGETYTNDQIRFSLDLENLGGIRPSLDSSGNVRYVAVMTAAEDSGKLLTENPYRDRIEGDILVYTAQGREGTKLWRVGTSDSWNSTQFPRRFLDSSTLAGRLIDSSVCLSCCDTIRKIRQTRRARFGGYGYLNSGSTASPMLCQSRTRRQFLQRSWRILALTVPRVAQNEKLRRWSKGYRDPQHRLPHRSKLSGQAISVRAIRL